MKTSDCSPRASLASIAATSGAPIPSSAAGSRLGANVNAGRRAGATARSGSLSQR